MYRSAARRLAGRRGYAQQEFIPGTYSPYSGGVQGPAPGFGDAPFKQNDVISPVSRQAIPTDANGQPLGFLTPKVKASVAQPAAPAAPAQSPSLDVNAAQSPFADYLKNILNPAPPPTAPKPIKYLGK